MKEQKKNEIDNREMQPKGGCADFILMSVTVVVVFYFLFTSGWIV